MELAGDASPHKSSAIFAGFDSQNRMGTIASEFLWL